jgi:GGDEF domain-containing protein
LDALREPHCVDDVLYTCLPSVGTYLYTTGDLDDLAAIDLADQSMYSVKRRGRNGLEMAECPSASTTPLRKAVGR